MVSRELLRDGPRSLKVLSHAHPDGWGLAIRTHDDWLIHRSTACAARCPEFDGLVERLETRLLIAHVRQRTVGAVTLANTHPFRRGPFVFAHNGTLRELGALVARISAARLAEVEGDTDSERLFAFILTHVDQAGDVERGVCAAVAELYALGDVGAATFLLSCGSRLYAHRLGRTLFTLVRRGDDQTGATIVASERLTDEPWTELAERALLVIDDAAVRPLAA
jgi:glutamine amidotransferase